MGLLTKDDGCCHNLRKADHAAMNANGTCPYHPAYRRFLAETIIAMLYLACGIITWRATGSP